MDDAIRIIVALVFAAVIFWQSRVVAGRPNQRRAYQLAAGAMLLVAGVNAAVAAGLQNFAVQIALGSAALVAMLAAAALLVRAYMAGEMRAPNQRARAMAREYRDQREREIDAGRRKPDDGGPETE